MLLARQILYVSSAINEHDGISPGKPQTWPLLSGRFEKWRIIKNVFCTFDYMIDLLSKSITKQIFYDGISNNTFLNNLLKCVIVWNAV